ncbi:MAG: serine hydrolase domain-containing protein, partial [Aggregatilineales bacterium]
LQSMLPYRISRCFDMASVTKLFTSTAFMTLWHSGKVTPETRLVDIIPEFGAINPRSMDGGQDPHSKERLAIPDDIAGKTANPDDVTFWHLLTHTSGLPPWRDVYNAAGNAPVPPGKSDPVERDARWQKAIAALCNYPFVGFPSDNVVRYSDIGLMLLGEAVSRVHGTPGKLDVAIQERVLDPLNLKQVCFNPVHEHNTALDNTVPTEIDDTWRQRRAWGEVHDENACGIGGVAGHAGIFATAQNIARFGQAWLNGGTAWNLSPEIVGAATAEQVESDGTRRGLGFALKTKTDSFSGDHSSMKSYGHTGFTGTSLWIDLEHELVIAILTNRVYPGRHKPGIHTFRRAVHDMFYQMLTTA